MRHLLLFIFLISGFYGNSQEEKETKKYKIVYETEFSEDDGLWAKHSTQYTKYGWENDCYTISIDTIGWYNFIFSPYSTVNFRYSIATKLKIELSNPKGVGAAGFIFDHVDEFNYKYFVIYTNGTYAIYQKKGGRETGLVYPTVSPYIDKGLNAYNKIELRNKQTLIEIYINGELVISHPISIVDAYGRVGFYSCSVSDGHYTPLKSSFDNFVLKKLK